MIKGYPGSVYGKTDRTKTFAETWESVEKFIEDYNSIGIPTTISTDSATTLYYLLYARYANSHVASSDANRFKYNLFGTIWQYAPNWEKKLEIQKRLRELNEEQIREGVRQIYNKADNPSNDPSMFTDNELQFINNQNVIKSRKGTLEGYNVLMGLLEDDVTENFLRRFKTLFKVIVMPELPLLYSIEGEEDDE